jgi:uncharacterized glyoxalase superfamily protein PhnB
MSIHEVFPYLCVHDARQAIEFYTQVFGGVEQFRLVEPRGRIGHAEIVVGGRTIMLAEEFPEFGFTRPDAAPGRSVVLHLHVDDADPMVARAVAAGASVVRPAADQFYGERSGTIRDPFGHHWLIGHHIEDVTPEEMQRRYAALCGETT